MEKIGVSVGLMYLGPPSLSKARPAKPMKNQLKKYSGAFSETRAENKRLKAEIETLKTEKAELAEQLKAATTESIQKRLKTGKLQEDYEKARSM